MNLYAHWLIYNRCRFCLHTPVYPGICKHNSPFTIRNRVRVIPFSINQLPACLHTGVDVYVEISAQSRVKNQPALSISVSTKHMLCPIVQFPCKTFIGTANTAETHQNRRGAVLFHSMVLLCDNLDTKISLRICFGLHTHRLIQMSKY